jgi:hypothetical protein
MLRRAWKVIHLEILRDLHVLSSPKYKNVFRMPSLGMEDVRLRALFSYPVFKNSPVIGGFTENMSKRKWEVSRKLLY